MDSRRGRSSDATTAGGSASGPFPPTGYPIRHRSCEHCGMIQEWRGRWADAPPCPACGAIPNDDLAMVRDEIEEDREALYADLLREFALAHPRGEPGEPWRKLAQTSPDPAPDVEIAADSASRIARQATVIDNHEIAQRPKARRLTPQSSGIDNTTPTTRKKT